MDKNPQIDYRKRSSTSSSSANQAKKEAAAAVGAASNEVCPDNDRVVPIYEFNEVPDFCLDEENMNLFQDGCNIDNLLDDIPCAPPTMNNNGGKFQYCGGDVDHKLQQEVVQVKKEMDLVEMMSHVNQILWFQTRESLTYYILQYIYIHTRTHQGADVEGSCETEKWCREVNVQNPENKGNNNEQWHV